MKTKTTRKDKKKKEIQEEEKKEMEKIFGRCVIYILKLHAQGWESHI